MCVIRASHGSKCFLWINSQPPLKVRTIALPVSLVRKLSFHQGQVCLLKVRPLRRARIEPSLAPRSTLLGAKLSCDAVLGLQSCLTLCNPMDCSPPGSSVHGDSPGKNTGVGCHALLQGIFPTQGSNPDLPHCRCLYCLSHQGSP